MENLPSGLPFNSGGTRDPSISTEATIITTPTRANAEALESLWMSRYRDNGYETPIVHRAIRNCRFANILRTGIVGSFGNAERRT